MNSPGVAVTAAAFGEVHCSVVATLSLTLPEKQVATGSLELGNPSQKYAQRCSLFQVVYDCRGYRDPQLAMLLSIQNRSRRGTSSVENVGPWT
jgi:hypothetical protein